MKGPVLCVNTYFKPIWVELKYLEYVRKRKRVEQVFLPSFLQKPVRAFCSRSSHFLTHRLINDALNSPHRSETSPSAHGSSLTPRLRGTSAGQLVRNISAAATQACDWHSPHQRSHSATLLHRCYSSENPRWSRLRDSTFLVRRGTFDTEYDIDLLRDIS